MIRIRALNEEAINSDDDSQGVTVIRKPTREVQEQDAMDLYNSSFELVAAGKYEEAISLIGTVLDLPFFEEDDSKKCTPVQIQIKLGCLKTLSSIYYSLLPNPEEAAKVMKLALALDPTNVTLWYRLGQVAIKLMDLDLAYYAFAQGFDTSSNHWGCLENLVTLSYVLFDSCICLEYCAIGLGKDPGFIRGLVFRDHIFRLQPSIKEEALSNWSVLATEHKYSKDWEQKYMSEVRNLLRKQTELAEENLRKERALRPVLYVCRYYMKSPTFAEVCRVLTLLYKDAKKDYALLRPVELKFEISLELAESTSNEQQEQNANEGNEAIADGNSSTANDPNALRVESDAGGEITQGGSQSTVANGTDNCDKSGDESQSQQQNAEKEQDDEANKKKKRDVKWWQMEGKRRSQRVRGYLYSTASPARVSKETDFATRLNSIIPETLLNTKEEAVNESTLEPSVSSASLPVPEEEAYFACDAEKLGVEEFLAQNAKCNTMDLTLALTRCLCDISDREWPEDLASNYLKLYPLYRSHVPQPDPYSCDIFIQRSLPNECAITLTMLELYRESFQSAEKLKADDNFNIVLFYVSELSIAVEVPKFSFRYYWLVANYHLSLAQAGLGSFSTAKCYLEELEEALEDDTIIKIATKQDNIISLDTVRKKLILIRRSENIHRVSELYESKSFAELINILPFSIQLESSEGELNLTNRHYLADSYFQLQRYEDCHSECLSIIKNSKLPANNQVLHKTVILLKRVVRLEDYNIPLHLTQFTIRTLISLLVENRLTIPVILPISPWCILQTLLFKLEQSDPALYLSDDSNPPSIQILQFAHEQLGRSGKCSLNKGKLLNYTLDVLLPLVSNELYVEHESLQHCIEQAIFCLFGHPAKLSKFRYLTDHGNPNVALDLARARQLYDYYRPEKLPEFDSYNSISESDAALFLQILSLVTDKPEGAFNKLKEFVNGDTDTEQFSALEGPVSALRGTIPFDDKLLDIFYLLGDHYFKIKEWTKSTEFYTWDLAVTPVRFDSWAGIALAKAERITTLLNSCGTFKIMEVMTVAGVAAKCFQNALELNPSSSKLNIEFGSFLYAMHAFCSRLLKQSTDQLSLEHFDLVEAKKEEFLNRAVRCFEPSARNNSVVSISSSSDGNQEEEQHEELWLNHYMVGKVTEKLNPHSPGTFLAHYEMAGKLLHQQGAAYPLKVNYYSPQELAIEALEIFYRIHASILNYIEKHDYNAEMDTKLLSFVERANDSPFMKPKMKRPESASETKKKKQDRALADVKVLLDDMVGRVEVLEQQEARKASESSTTTHSSSTSSDEDSSDTTSGDNSNASIQPPTQPTSFRLSVFQDMLREAELRELRLAEAARIAEEKKKSGLGDKDADDGDGEADSNSRTVPISEEELHFKHVKYGKVISYCVRAMQECISRFPAHHKSYFRIAYTYSTFCKTHLKIGRAWLLGNGNFEKKKILGLFGERKPHNFFNGIWRNPIDDIDRPGSFPYHMSKTVQNLLEVLNSLNDHEMLVEIGIQLSKVPDSDKKYLQNVDREQFSRQAMTSAVGAARRKLSALANYSQEVALGIYSSYLKIQKSTLKENGMGPVLISAYENYVISKGSIPEPVTVEFAVKYFQHVAWTTKLKTSQKSKWGTTALIPINIPPIEGNEIGGQIVAEIPVLAVDDNEKRQGPARKVASKRLSFADQAAPAERPPNLTRKPNPRPGTQVSGLPSTSSKTIPGKSSTVNSTIRKKPALEPSPALKKPALEQSPALKKPALEPSPTLKKSISISSESGKSGREMPNLVSIPSMPTAEDYLRQMGILYGLQTPSISTSSSRSASVSSKPQLGAVGTEEFILPDLLEQDSTPSIASNWQENYLKSSSLNLLSPVSSVVVTTANKDKNAAENMNSGKGTTQMSTAQKYKELSAQAHEAMVMFEKTRSMWDKSSSSYKTPSLFTNPTTTNSNLLSQYANFCMSAAAGQSEIISKFQLKGTSGNANASTAGVAFTKPRRASDSVSLVNLQSLISPGERQVANKSKLPSSTISPGSIVLEGETLPVYGYTGAGDAAAANAASARAKPKSATSQKMRKRSRSGGLISAKFPLRVSEVKAREPQKKRNAATPPGSAPRYKSPPASIPLSTIASFNTSPFKAQATMVSNSGQFVKAPVETPGSNRRVVASPPAAHSANKTPPHASSSGCLEIIDLTTKSPTKAVQPPPPPPTLVAATVVADSETGRGVKRPMPQMIAIGSVSQKADKSPPPSLSLPPKKKLAMRRVENPNSPRSPRTIAAPVEATLPEIITIDSD